MGVKEELKAAGLELAEEQVKVVVEVLCAKAEKIAAASENKVDDALVAVIPMLKPFLLSLVDKIDQEVG